MIWGVSFALHEEAVVDRRTGPHHERQSRRISHPGQRRRPGDARPFWSRSTIPYVNALGIKGVGEIGVTGTAGAVANAVWHATGVRPRALPDPAGGADVIRV